ncbi:class D sortase [Candidatus Gracilibacteria bacterium]|nr:class D sortase [Candidatus Gracilibacteria bacterium]
MRDEFNNFKEDPYRNNSFGESNFVFEKKDEPAREESSKAHFSLHIEKKHPIPKKTQQHKTPEPKRNFKTIISDASHQIIASVVIFAIGFLAMNFSAFYSIGKFKVQSWLQGDEPTILEEFVQEQVPTKTVLQVSKDLNSQKVNIPELSLSVGPSDNRIIIPRINQNLPVVRVSSQNLVKRDWKALETDIQSALKNGVVHYPGTSLPGQNGNVVITGHSSYFPWDPGRFKDVFALLHQVVEGDEIVLYQDQEKFSYVVQEIKVVLPEDIEVLKQTPDDRLTLITCTPVGTNLKRLIVIAKPVANKVAKAGDILR